MRSTRTAPQFSRAELDRDELRRTVPRREAPERFGVRSHAATHVGRRRKGNEDAYFHDDTLRLLVVADGMGGHAAGDVASREAVDAVHGMVKRGLLAMGDVDSALSEDRARAACRLLEGAIQAATYMIFALGEIDRSKSGMGTTLSAAIVIGDSIVMGQVGDSRIYQVRNGRALQITEDHTLVAWQIKSGLLSPEEAETSPHKNVITRAVGSKDYVEVDTFIVPVQLGDRYVLCSDGLHGYLDAEEIGDIASGDPAEAVDIFIGLANERGGRDNITVIVAEVV